MTYAPPQHVASAGTTPADLRELLLVPAFLSRRDADELFRHCLADLDWRQERVRLFGREMDAPRLCACYGRPGLAYRYSGVTRRCAPWTAPLREAVERIGQRLGASFNFVLANRYRDGSDAVGWHADDERGIGPVIASVSLGSERLFRVRPREGGPSTALRLGHGDLVLMWGRCQRDFRHALPRTRAPVGTRVNLTLRRVGSPGFRARAGVT
ncbi:MAG: alpha-ketoglutarate-dependent dioxygenase AlkB [Gammaproteobacteria bacterium]|nr:alpha-ketoglutarate-dependent dioxygenase AlkB [Gammaproteobacteria bacterium]